VSVVLLIDGKDDGARWRMDVVVDGVAQLADAFGIIGGSNWRTRCGARLRMCQMLNG